MDWILALALLLVLIGICYFILRNQDTRNYLSHLFGFTNEREPDAKTEPPKTTETLASVIAKISSNQVRQPSTTTDGYDSDPQTKGRRFENKNACVKQRSAANASIEGIESGM